jgi:phosphoribosylglycinamide formyltransferase-1
MLKTSKQDSFLYFWSVRNSRKKIAVFASGSGTNAENLVRYFSNSDIAGVELILCNNPSAGVIERARNLDVPCMVFNRQDFYESSRVLDQLSEKKIDLVVLAGFLWLIPVPLIIGFEKRIINIHPALLPGFGGKGFYGMKVHRSVIESQAHISGITIHYVNEKFDEGEIIFQAACYVHKEDTDQSLAKKIHDLEYTYFPTVIEKILIQAETERT